MARANGKAERELPAEFIDAVVEDFRAELESAGPEIVEGIVNSKGSEASMSVTVALKEHAATKKRSAYHEATMTVRVRAPREPHYYSVEMDGQGVLAFEGRSDGPTEAPTAH